MSDDTEFGANFPSVDQAGQNVLPNEHTDLQALIDQNSGNPLADGAASALSLADTVSSADSNWQNNLDQWGKAGKDVTDSLINSPTEKGKYGTDPVPGRGMFGSLADAVGISGDQKSQDDFKKLAFTLLAGGVGNLYKSRMDAKTLAIKQQEANTLQQQQDIKNKQFANTQNMKFSQPTGLIYSPVSVAPVNALGVRT